MIKTILDILNKDEKINLYFIIFLFIIISILELLSIGLIYPLMYFIFDNSYINNFYYKKYIADFNFSKNTFVALNFAFIVLLYFCKNLFIVFVKLKTFKYRRSLELRVSNNILTKYFFIDYEKIYNKTTEHIFRNINITRDFSSTVFALTGLFQEILTFILLIGFLTYLDPEFVIFIFFIFGMAILLFYFAGKKKLFKLGDKSQVNEKALYKVIFEGVSALKIIKLFGKEQYTLNKIMSKIEVEANIKVKSDLLLQLPSHIIEVLAILIISILGIFVTNNTNNTVDIISTIAIFAATTTRLVPSSTRIIAYLQNLRYYLPKVYIIKSEIEKNEVIKFTKRITNKVKNSNKISFNKNINLKNLTFYYKRNIPIFNSLSLQINKKEFIGIYGESGSGKSTLNNLITGLLTPKNGEILVDGDSVHENIRDWQKKVGFVPQQPFFSNDTIKNNILFGENPSKVNTKILNQVIKYSQLETFLHTLPRGINTHIGEKGINLSAGQLQRISIARALYKKPDLLILDEATNALDEENEKTFFACIEKLKGKITVIINSHQKHNFYFCDKIYKVNNFTLKKIK